MKSLVIHNICDLSKRVAPLELVERPVLVPEAGQILIKVRACGVCHTELDEIEGRTPPPVLPVVPGHQVVGIVEKTGAGVKTHSIGDRVGVGWIYSSCGSCQFCRRGEENLCPDFMATGRDTDGGYAEYMIANEGFAFNIPKFFTDEEAAPLLCAGAIGWRSLKLAFAHRKVMKLGLSGFGASAHIVLKLVLRRFPGVKVFVFSRSPAERSFAKELGAAWAGDFGEKPPQLLDAIIDTTPAWKPVLSSLECLEPGGRLVINAIRKETSDRSLMADIDYARHLWMEKEIKSVANIAKNDIPEFLDMAAEIGLRPEIQTYPLEGANTALLELKQRKIRGAKVLKAT